MIPAFCQSIKLLQVVWSHSFNTGFANKALLNSGRACPCLSSPCHLLCTLLPVLSHFVITVKESTFHIVIEGEIFNPQRISLNSKPRSNSLLKAVWTDTDKTVCHMARSPCSNPSFGVSSKLILSLSAYALCLTKGERQMKFKELQKATLPT